MTSRLNGAGELADELAATVGQERIEHAVGQLPHERLVLLEPLRRDQPHQQRAVVGVGWGVEGDDLVAHRDGVAMRCDQPTDIVALERRRKSGERPSHRQARRIRGRVAEDGQCLVVARHHHDVVMGLAQDRAVAAQGGEVRVRVRDQLVVPEEIP